MQKTHVMPASRMYFSLVARVVLSSIGKMPNSPRRSECPISTWLMPMSFICSTAISPVNAPQPLKLQFCGVTRALFVNLSAQYATCSGDGHTYTSHLLVSQALMLATRPSSAFIDSGLHFQLPPTTGRREARRKVAPSTAAAAATAPAKPSPVGALLPAKRPGSCSGMKRSPEAPAAADRLKFGVIETISNAAAPWKLAAATKTTPNAFTMLGNEVRMPAGPRLNAWAKT
mmetsp:Transcript_8385/g.23373  ORF Transcript_8385/g.23373 Transcript_8385/m.23373 type:complete len:230 (+) Transcript_8385:565-1254(+)